PAYSHLWSLRKQPLTPTHTPQEPGEVVHTLTATRSSHCPRQTARDPDRRAVSSRLDVAQERFDLASHGLGLPRQFFGSLQDLMGRSTGVAGGLLDAGHIRRNFAGAERRLLHVAGNLLGRRALLFHRTGDRSGD